MSFSALFSVHAPARFLHREARLVRFAAEIFVAAFSPATWTRSVRAALAQSLCRAAGQPLAGYALASLLLGAATTHIVATTAANYGLSHLALEAVARVLVVELIPLAAALFVALRSGVELLDRIAALRAAGHGAPEVFDLHILPGALANLFAVVLLTATSGVLVLAVAYAVIHGLSLWGLSAYTHLVGRVFDPVTAPGLLLKVFLFGLAVGVAPATVALESPCRLAGGGAMRAMARLFLLLALIEGAALLLLSFRP